MGIIDATRFVERLQFFNGQQLFADDLQGIDVFNREMRWLHNKSLHQPGIGSGYAIGGAKGDREITVGPGYAVDSEGREIVLTQSVTIPIPPVSGDGQGGPAIYDLVISYPDESALEEAETRQGICMPAGVVRLREAPVFCWIRLEADARGNLHPKNPGVQSEIDQGMKIVLTRIKILDCKLDDLPMISQRRSARPAQSPYIAGGEESSISWKLESQSETHTPIFLLSTSVDTSSAGFVTQPYYIARIEGTRTVEIDGETILLLDTVQIENADATRFAIQVLILAYVHRNIVEFTGGDAAASSSDETNEKLQKEIEKIVRQWKVVWLGVEG